MTMMVWEGWCTPVTLTTMVACDIKTVRAKLLGQVTGKEWD
jgi:hypothetical protein